MSDSCAVIAGAGRFPFHVAHEAKRQGLQVVGLGITGWVDPSLAGSVDAYEEVSVGQVGQLVKRLKAHQIQQAVMAGKVTKGVLLDPRIRFDLEALAILGQLREFSVNGLLVAIAKRLAKDGITLLDSSTFLKSYLCPPGPVTTRRPTAQEDEDIRTGVRMAQQMAALDVGQTVVVKGGVILAVEALEGTDEAIRRGARLGGPGAVVVKMAGAKQDMRFDLPVLGLETIDVAAEAGVRCIAAEAHKTLLLDRPALVDSANAAGLALIGIEPAQ